MAVAVVMVLATIRRDVGGDGAVKTDAASGDWRRYLAMLLDGMRPAPVPLPARR